MFDALCTDHSDHVIRKSLGIDEERASKLAQARTRKPEPPTKHVCFRSSAILRRSQDAFQELQHDQQHHRRQIQTTHRR
jgi:hypothetical protein